MPDLTPQAQPNRHHHFSAACCADITEIMNRLPAKRRQQFLYRRFGNGVGIGVLARFVITDELEKGEIVEVLPDIKLPPFSSVYVVYPARQHLPAKTRLFLDYLYRHVERYELALQD